MSVLDAGFVEQRAGVEATVAADYARANEAHGREKAALSAAFQTLQGHYRQSYLEQRAQYQIRKDDLVNQVVFFFWFVSIGSGSEPRRGYITKGKPKVIGK